MFEFLLTEDIPYKALSVNLEKGTEAKLVFASTSIVFIKDAPVSLRFAFTEEKSIDKGQFFLLPQNFVCHLSSWESQEITVLLIPNITTVYIYLLPPFFAKETINLADLLFPLDIAKPIYTLLESIRFYIEEQKDTNLLTGLKIYELFCFIKSCYSEDMIQSFFTPIFSQEYAFALFVLSHYSSVKSAEELAHLSNYTFSGFDKKFRKVFHKAPYKWMLQKKVTKIYREICSTSKPIKVIAEENGFANSSHLGNFCRKHIGESPAAIRKRTI